jgi:hypothetical protein
MLVECATRAACKIYQDEGKQQHMINDLMLFFQGLKLSMLLIIVSMLLGFSLSLVSLVVEGAIIYFIYKQSVEFYTAIRGHNLEQLDGNPENELNTLMKELCGDIVSFMKTSYVSARTKDNYNS